MTDLSASYYINYDYSDYNCSLNNIVLSRSDNAASLWTEITGFVDTCSYELNNQGVSSFNYRGEYIVDELEVSSTQELEEKYGIAIDLFPNPSNGVFELRLGEYPLSAFNIEVVDVLGRNVSSFEVRDHHIELKGKGIYFIRLFDDFGSGTIKRVVVQ